ncbi:MAG TPA: cyclase family protein [Holophagaceae bacterium]|nr:cyclase family protein [Holophagaceae bacterium]
MGRILDISPAISARLAVWPGDQPFRRAVALSMAAGANLDLSSVTTTVHLGAHADAPSHFLQGGPGIAEVELSPYLGACQVMAVDLPRGARILPEHLSEEIRAPRLLLRTDSFPDPESWNTDFNSLSPELVEHLHARGVVLVGLDTPSIDPFESKALEAHHALGRLGLRNLEGLVLDQVPSGLYTLVALPLRIEGADASPLRAVLLDHDALTRIEP